MTDTADRFVFRESVLSYLEKPEIRHAVNLLLDRKIGYLPQVFDHGQITDFYTACLAARQTQIEFVMDMADLWHRIWRAPKGWTPVPLDPADEDLNLDPVVRWDEQYFQCDFELKSKGMRASLWLWLTDLSEVELGVDVMEGDITVLRKGGLPSPWKWEDEQFSWEDKTIRYANGLDLAPFRAAAEAALERIERL
ncbi:hypothetical protein C7451_1095 [Blastomonas natatoria]|uniref:Uncharacterized protein n=1 Tax=Blastomonas natatoria TaxID=34015 RepID=A0A2V3UWS3_9SPHN|nr:hypothetical protein [Blastomonas natatoria]PXW73720.1 hypothetical protein C7451_1095 [Blastomonas natatoria]